MVIIEQFKKELSHFQGWLSCAFSLLTSMDMVFIIIQIKFDIDINKDEQSGTIWDHERKNQHWF
jgi:hypothetical protein